MATARDHNVIEQGDPHAAGGSGDTLREVDILSARTCVAAGVIVDEDERRRAHVDGDPNHITRQQRAAVLASLGDTVAGEKAIAGVQGEEPDLLMQQMDKPRADNTNDILRGSDDGGRQRSTLGATKTELQGGGQTFRRALLEPRQSRDAQRAEAGQSGNSSEADQQVRRAPVRCCRGSRGTEERSNQLHIRSLCVRAGDR